MEVQGTYCFTFYMIVDQQKSLSCSPSSKLKNQLLSKARNVVSVLVRNGESISTKSLSFCKTRQTLLRRYSRNAFLMRREHAWLPSCAILHAECNRRHVLISLQYQLHAPSRAVFQIIPCTFFDYFTFRTSFTWNILNVSRPRLNLRVEMEGEESTNTFTILK